MQVYGNKRAVFEALKSFRLYYPEEPVTVVSDDGEDFGDICKVMSANYIHSSVRTTQATMTASGVREWLRRIYLHCRNTNSDWVVLFEEDVRVLRHIRTFPVTEAAGPRMNSYSPQLTQELEKKFGNKSYGYGLCGGAIWRRKAYIEAYEQNHNVEEYAKYDPRVTVWADIPLTLLFHINNFNYSIWEEVSEIHHSRSPVIRDSAFDHSYKYWCGKPFTKDLLL